MQDVVIYEPIYREGQQLGQPLFRALPIANDRADWRELQIFVDMYRAGLHRQQALTGMLSPKFELKAGIGGRFVFDFIAQHPGADVYLFNPGSHLVYLAYNMWTQGEWFHPGIVDRAQELVDAVGVPLDIRTAGRHGAATLCYSNYWVASERFWDAYVGGVLVPIAELVESQPKSPTVRRVMEETLHTTPAPFLPFIAERLFTTFLAEHSEFTTAVYLRDPAEASLSAFDRDVLAGVRGRVERADAEGDFPPDLQAWLMLLARLRSRFSLMAFAHEPHPHTGWSYDADHVTRILKKIDAIPVPQVP